MQAVLMAGGKGTRLRPFTAVLPKPLVPVGEISILEMVLKQLSHFGFREIILSVGHKAELIMAVVGDGSRFNLRVRYYQEKEPLGTLGSLAFIEDLDDNFLVMNGDICTNLAFDKIYKAHVKHGCTATVGVYPRIEKMEFGVVELNDHKDKIIGFKEKPISNFFVSMGVNVFSKEILSVIPKGKFFGFDTLMMRLIDEKKEVYPYIFDGHWLDIGRPDDYERMYTEFQENPSLYLPFEV